MEDFTCPRCKTSKFQNPSLKMMVNICGHGLCESCVDLLFLKGSGSCPECRIPLRRHNFRVQLFEDAAVEKEIDIRKRVLRDFTKKEEDFADLQQYNDYLEEVETIIHNLTNDIEIVATNKKIEQYKRDNRDQIVKSKGRLGREEYELEEMIEMEKQQNEHRKQVIIDEETESKQKKIRDKEALIDELMFSNANAMNIIDSFEQKKKKEVEASEKKAEDDVKNAQPSKVSAFSSGIQFGKQQAPFLPLPMTDDGPLYVYKPLVLPKDGPRLPEPDQIASSGYTKHVRSENTQERAGGFRSNIACMRALQDAFSGLYHVTSKPPQNIT